MITLVIGFVSLLVFGLIFGWIGVLIAGITVAILVCMPLEGYYSRELENEILLIKLKRLESSGKTYYAEKSNHKLIIAYDNRNTYGIEYEAYEEATFCGIIKIYESEGYTEPILRTFTSKPIREMWTFCPFNRVEHVLSVPKGTVIYKKDKDEEKMEVVV